MSPRQAAIARIRSGMEQARPVPGGLLITYRAHGIDVQHLLDAYDEAVAALAKVTAQRDGLLAAVQPVLAKIEPKPSPFQPLLLDLVAAVAAAQPQAEPAEGGA